MGGEPAQEGHQLTSSAEIAVATAASLHGSVQDITLDMQFNK